MNDVEPIELNEAMGQAAQQSRAREDWSHCPDEELQSGQLRRRIESAVNSLPQDLRAIFILRDVGEMSTEETASKLGVSIPAAKTRLHRARRALRESLGDYVAC
jgi:RNA polymerase sigma-70 factor (ECF subfamily)